MIREKWMISEDYKAASIDILADNLPSLRARIGIKRISSTESLDDNKKKIKAFRSEIYHRMDKEKNNAFSVRDNGAKEQDKNKNDRENSR